MTFNLRTGRSSDGPDSWDLEFGSGTRKELAVEVIKQYQPDLLGVQECMPFQLGYINKHLEEYGWFGTTRRGDGADDEFCAIFYKKAAVAFEDGGNVWLSDTPDTPGNISWGNRHPRMITWGRFSLHGYPRSLYLFNTHFPLQQFSLAQQRSTDLMAALMKNIAPEEVVLACGDFNADIESYVVTHLCEEGFQLTWNTAEEKSGPDFSFHRFQGLDYQDSLKIDWIFSRLPQSGRVRSLETVAFQKNGRYPSDHFPVYVKFALPKEFSESYL